MTDTIVMDPEIVMHMLSEDTTEVQDHLNGYRLLQSIAQSRVDKLEHRIFMDIRLFCSYVQRDIVASYKDLSSIALKVLGFFLQRKSFITRLPDDEASKFLLTLLALITTTREKTVCGLGLWCLAVQEMKTSLVATHLKMIVAVLLHGIDNPLGSMSITYEAFQAVKQLTRQLPDEMRNLSSTWAPPVYQKLLSSNTKIVELAESCLSGTQSVLLPPLPRLSEVVVVDIQQKLLSRIKDLIKLEGRSQCTAVQAWGWLVKLLCVKSAEEKSLINVMLKLLESCFVSPSAHVRSASQVAWVPVIDLFIPSPGEAGADGILGPLAPSTGVSLSLKRLNLLLCPLLNTMSWEKDMMVQRNCCCTWVYLLCRLGRSVNERPIFDAAVLPMLEIVFNLDKKLRDGSVWQACVDIVTNAISCNRLHETRSDPETQKSKRSGQSPKTPAGITYSGIFSESQHKNISWSSWNLDRLDSFIRIVHLLWSSGLKQLDKVNYEDRHLTTPEGNLEASQDCWRLLVRAVEAEGRNTVRPSSDHITAVHMLLQFLSDVCTEVEPTNLFPPAWALIDTLIGGLGHNVIASSFYRIRFQFAEYMGSMPETGGDCSPNADFSVLELVTPVVYISAAWFKMVFETTSVGQSENMWLQPIEKLITTGRTGFDIMGNYLGFSSILDHLAKESYRHLEESPDTKKASLAISKGDHVKHRNWHFLLAVWRTVAEKLRELAERFNDVSPVGGCQRDSGYHVVVDVLLFPIKCFLMLSPGDDASLQGALCGNSAWRYETPQSETWTSKAELRSIEGVWFKLFDSVLRISSLKSPQPNSFTGLFFQRLLRIMRSSLQEQAQLLPEGMEKSKIDYCNVSDPCLRFLGDVVSHAMKHAEISSLAMLAISRKRRKTGFGTSSVRVQCVAGMELEDANNLKDLLTVAGRILTLSFKKFKHDERTYSMHESVIRVLGALTSLMQHVTSQNDSVLLLQALAQPLASWFGVNSEASGCRIDGATRATLLPSSLLEGLAQAWDGLLSCLQTCRPCLVFDSKLLLVQASSLAPAFLHHHDAISNRALAFWEGTYGSKASHLNYPPALVKVFNSLRHKVQLSLPGWTTRIVPAQEINVHNAPHRLYGQPFSRVRQFQGRIQSMRDAVEKRGVTMEDHQSRYKGSHETKLGLAEQPGAVVDGQKMDQASCSIQPSGNEACTEDTNELHQSFNDANDISLEQESEFMPTPEGNALIDALVNTESVPKIRNEEIVKRPSPEQSTVPSADVLLSTDVYISGEDGEAAADDSQTVDLPSELVITNFLQDCSRPEVELKSEKMEPTSHGDSLRAQNGELHIGSNVAKNVNEMGTLVTPPIVLNDVPSVPPKIPMGVERVVVERPSGTLNAGPVQVTVCSGSKGTQAVSNLPRRRKKLKFQDDSQEVEYVVIPHSQRKKAGPLTDRQREVRFSQRTSGRVVKTYTRADFSQSSNGCDDDLIESQALEGALDTTRKENIPPSNSVSFQQCASGHTAASRLKVRKVARFLRGNDSKIVDECLKTVPLDQVDYVQLKIRLVELMQSVPPLTYRQIFDQEQYECLPKLIQKRLISQFCHLRKRAAESMNVKNDDQPPSNTAEQPQRVSEKSPSGCNTNLGDSRDLPEVNREEQFPSSCGLKRKPELHGYSKKSFRMPTMKNLRSSGKLRGGKNWRINSESGKVITARLGIKKIVAKRQQKCRKLSSKAEKRQVSALNEAIVDPNLAHCSTKSWDWQMQGCSTLMSEKSTLQHAGQTLVESSSRREENSPSTSTECEEESEKLQASQPMTERELSPELQGNSPFQVRKLNRGLLASAFNTVTKTGAEISSKDFIQGCRSTRVNSHNPRKLRAPKRVPSQDNSLDTDQPQFRIGERSVNAGEDATTSGALYGSENPRKLIDRIHFAPPSPPQSEGTETSLIFVDLQSERSPCRLSCASGGDEDENIRACLLKNCPPESSLNTVVSCEESIDEDKPSSSGDFKIPGDSVHGRVESDAERSIAPEKSSGDKMQSHGRTQEEPSPQRSTTVEPIEDPGKDRVGNLQLLLEREDVQVVHVLSALLASSKLEKMELSELTEVYKLVSKLKEAVAVAGQNHKGETCMFVTPTHV